MLSPRLSLNQVAISVIVRVRGVRRFGDVGQKRFTLVAQAIDPYYGEQVANCENRP
jgi:hypothetical protein